MAIEAVSPQTQTASTVFPHLSEFDHEQVVFCNDNDTGLKAIIGIHDTTLGPALGGTRFYNYPNDQDALVDVLRLSRGMTYKAAISGLNLGGGKAVIIGDPRKIKNEGLMRRFGKFVDNLNGKYITAEDVGITVQDMSWVHQETNHVTGIPESIGGSGNPSPVTAYGIYLGMKAAANKKFGSDSLEGKRIIVQGVGSVGSHLINHLNKENAKLFVFDIWEEAVKRAVEATGAKVISAEEVYTTEADIYSPNALGATLNPDTIPQLNVQVVAGGANNQLLDELRDGKALEERGILYAPDFLINAGGLINVYTEIEGYNRERAMDRCEGIYQKTLEVLDYAQENAKAPQAAALELAQQRLQTMARMQRYI